MKTLLIALCAISTTAFAQTPPELSPPLPPGQPMQLPPPVPRRAPFSESSEVLPENYVIKLVVSDTDQKTELTLVVATAAFKADTMDGKVTINGQLAPEGADGTVLLRYSLATAVQVVNETQTDVQQGEPKNTVRNITYQNHNLTAGVRLHFDEPIQILKSGTRSYELTISHLPKSARNGK